MSARQQGAAMSPAIMDESAIDRERSLARSRRWGWWYVAEHRIRAMRAYLTTFFVTAFGSPFLYLAGLGAGLGVMVDQAQGGQGVDGVPYLVFLAPALVLAGAMQQASQEATFGVFGGFKWQNTFWSMNSSPVTPRQMVLGFQVSLLARILPAVVIYLLALVVFGLADPLRVLVLLPVATLLALVAGTCVMAWVSTQENDRGQLSFIERFVIMPLTLFSGTYYPLETLPAALHWIGWISPLWHAVQLARWGLYGAATPGWLLVVHVAYLAALIFVGGWFSVRHFVRRLDK